jgi:transposase
MAAAANDFPPWPTVHGYFRGWRTAGVWVLLHRALYPQARLAAGRKLDPTVVIMDGQSVKTAEQGGARGFDGHKRVKESAIFWSISSVFPSPTALNQPICPTGE